MSQWLMADGITESGSMIAMRQGFEREGEWPLYVCVHVRVNVSEMAWVVLLMSNCHCAKLQFHWSASVPIRVTFGC